MKCDKVAIKRYAHLADHLILGLATSDVNYVSSETLLKNPSLRTKYIVNILPNMKILVDKDYYRRLLKHACKRDLNPAPDTWNPLTLAPRATLTTGRWMVKPNHGSCGKGIAVVDIPSSSAPTLCQHSTLLNSISSLN